VVKFFLEITEVAVFTGLIPTQQHQKTEQMTCCNKYIQKYFWTHKVTRQQQIFVWMPVIW